MCAFFLWIRTNDTFFTIIYEKYKINYVNITPNLKKKIENTLNMQKNDIKFHILSLRCTKYMYISSSCYVYPCPLITRKCCTIRLLKYVHCGFADNSISNAVQCSIKVCRRAHGVSARIFFYSYVLHYILWYGFAKKPIFSVLFCGRLYYEKGPNHVTGN